ncbi:MAG TPA: alkylmercury lyase family protein [Actinomycetes bacterium]|nr:alkylmercury lyase family protein [Actinomycetes bacterium]
MPLPADHDERRLLELRQVVYRTFVREGRPPAAAEAATALGTGEEEVLAGWRVLHDRHVLVLDADRAAIRMAHPFSARWMGFVVASEEQKWWGGCAWDSFGIMAALDRPVLVATTCIGCGRPLALRADPARPPEEAHVVHVLVPAARWWDDVVWACSNIRLACDAGHVAAWAARHGEPVGAVVDLPTMWRLASAWYGDRLRDDFRRRTPAEANAIFAGLGLTGPFWKLPG